MPLPPRLKEMKSQESAAGSKLVLRCETSSEYSSLRFKWFKNGNELNRKNKPQNIKIQKKPGESINQCDMYNSGLTLKDDIFCTPISKGSNEPSDRAVALEAVINQAEKFTLICGIENQDIMPHPDIVHNLSVKSSGFMIIHENSSGKLCKMLGWKILQKSELRINKASLADSGEYMCKVISKLGNDSASANITIVDSNEIITGMPASTEEAYVSSGKENKPGKFY
ncbi:hypothetical protein P7K49_027420 [Saguinus oedipus]|uniref:Ig-like domain-containing protein n=1 Tax=Saguinus oedipus TaxID=9490 RepID=A0ABQ9UBI0_SAGOE|nr:hypothetical protein P7K49_027420 [Saguinus oedipus]